MSLSIKENYSLKLISESNKLLQFFLKRGPSVSFRSSWTDMVS